MTEKEMQVGMAIKIKQGDTYVIKKILQNHKIIVAYPNGVTAGYILKTSYSNYEKVLR